MPAHECQPWSLDNRWISGSLPQLLGAMGPAQHHQPGCLPAAHRAAAAGGQVPPAGRARTA
eukprot:scaffold376609_cov33-Prasinocladus_malaysianus.AAC.1